MNGCRRQWIAAVCLALVPGPFLTAEEWTNSSSAPAAAPSGDYQQLLERLSELEAEVEGLKPAPGVQPAAGQGIPPAPAVESVPMFYPAVPAPVVAAPSKPTFPTVQVNGAFQSDALFFDQSELNRQQLGDIQDGAGFRRTRLSASGAVAENVNYFVQLDFAFFGRPTFTDVWGEIEDVPWLGTVRIGQWKQPFSLEVPTSYRYQTFMERSLLFSPFEAFRHIGVGFYNHSEDENWTWAASGFRTGNDQYGDDIGDAGGWSAAARLTHLLWYRDAQDADKRLEYLHLGGAFWFGDPGNDLFRYATIPEAFVGAFGVPAGTVPGTSGVQVPTVSNGTPPFVDTGSIPTNTFTHVGGELLWAHGPLAWQSEVQMAHLEQIGGPALQFWGFYSEVMLFLTGESKPYLRKLGQIDRIRPLRPFIREAGCERGPGAWELAYRVSHIDLNDQNTGGGQLTDLTAGLNWYLNGFTKVQFNYIHAALNRNFNGVDGPTHADIYGVRFQVDF